MKYIILFFAATLLGSAFANAANHPFVFKQATCSYRKMTSNGLGPLHRIRTIAILQLSEAAGNSFSIIVDGDYIHSFNPSADKFQRNADSAIFLNSSDARLPFQVRINGRSLRFRGPEISVACIVDRDITNDVFRAQQEEPASAEHARVQSPAVRQVRSSQ